MYRVLSHWMIVCFLLLNLPLLGGCGYVLLPISQCKTDADCLTQQYCAQDTCKERPTSGKGTVGIPCLRDADCLATLRCEQTCQPRPPAENTTEPSTENATEIPTDGGSTEIPTDRGSTEIPHDEEPTSPPADGGPQDGIQPETPPTEWMNNESIPESLPEPIQPPTQCVPGAIRPCRYQGSDQNRPCSLGQQLCLFDQSWDTCKPRTGVQKRWVSPDQREVCDEMDNDCDGFVDEGCASSQSYSCGDIYHIYYDAPTHHIALAHNSPTLYNSNYTYNSTREIAVHYDEHRKAITLSRLAFSKATTDPRGPQYEWLLSLPAPTQGSFRAAFNAQASLLATYTNDALYLWEILYTADGMPHVGRSIKVNSETVYGMHFVGDGRHLVTFHNRYDAAQKKNINDVVGWQVTLPANAPLQVSQRTKVNLPEDHLEWNWNNNPAYDAKTQLLAVASYTKALLIDANTLQVVKTLPLGMPPDPENRSLAFHPTKPIFLIATVAYTDILTFDITRDAQGIPSGQSLKLYKPTAYEDLAESWGFHPTTGELYSKSYRGLYRWNESPNGQPTAPTFLAGPASAYAIHHPSKIAVVAHNAGWLRLFSITDGKQLASLSLLNATTSSAYLYNAQFADDGTLLLLFSDRIEAWHLDLLPNQPPTLRKKQALTQHTKTIHSRTPLVLSADGNTVAWYANNSVEVWTRSNSGNYSLFYTLQGFSDPVNTIALDNNGKYLVTGEYQKVRVWVLDSSQASSILKTYTNQNVVGVGFHTTPSNETFLLATTNDGSSHAWSFVPTPNGLPQTTALDGEVKAFLSGGTQARSVLYPLNKAYSFLLVGDSIATQKLLKRDFFLSPVQPNGNRKISESSVTREFPNAEGVQSIEFAPQSAPDRNSFFYGFSTSDLRAWYCPF